MWLLSQESDPKSAGLMAEPHLDFSAVYEQHFDFLYRSARAFGVSDANVDDVLQDVFIVVHQKLHLFDGKVKVRTWLARILFNTIREHRRRYKRKGDFVALDSEVASPTGDPEKDLQQAQAVAFLMQSLAAMDEGQRTVFVLAEIEELTAPEIAEVMGTPINTVYSRLRLAREKHAKLVTESRDSAGNNNQGGAE